MSVLRKLHLVSFFKIKIVDASGLQNRWKHLLNVCSICFYNCRLQQQREEKRRGERNKQKRGK